MPSNLHSHHVPNVRNDIRKIVHIDMDAFYASVEQRDNPSLRGRPVAVGGVGERSVICTASYEARQFGVRAAMPSIVAQRKCADLIFVLPRFDVYRAVSNQIQEIFAEYTPLIEPLSLDEAYLDVTQNHKGVSLATDVAREIRQKIFDETGLTASAGISYCKFLAKTASSQRKPNGQFVIPPENAESFIATLPIGKFHGIGPTTEAKMQRLGIHNGADLKKQTAPFLDFHFGKSGHYFYQIARGVDNRPVCPDRERKSVGAENTFLIDLHTYEQARTELTPLIDKVSKHCQSNNLAGRTITLKVKFNDFEQITRSRSVGGAVNDPATIAENIEHLLRGVCPFPKPVRLLGVTLSGFYNTPESAGQLALDI